MWIDCNGLQPAWNKQGVIISLFLEFGYDVGMSDKIWANSGDSHFLEPADLWHQIMPKEQAERMPRTEMISENEELVTVDGKSFTRTVAKLFTSKGATGETIVEMSHRPPGSRDVNLRLADLDEEGIWAEVMYQSIGLWCS